ncbi:uncharacterized protein LACBIDRAFT_298608 [Laccaria bicolor S238N-H82]|uniref:Predicted protein n=1 Tax=Laccaria bicolor (strain S238N-H82 / ATCC MYA-4686) TaxID=486041 RepID=B0DD78_LACBS|nr:uncharacterized protein LACBIDRAFT_298608 [Laccaria bicolor S238N-H82]EDR07431.1 predicted protein [Laccaria bicolor S238N-H82]|eukprot:XP_001881823.1 predicted protein [Laccaria bicolor S238N-H82]
MDKLTNMFSSLLPPQMRDYAEQVYRDNMSAQNANIRVIPPDPRTEGGPPFDEIDESGGIDNVLKQMINSFAKNQTPRFPIPQRLQCANVEVEKYKTCDNPGTMACSGCKLVSYCSKVLFFQFCSGFFSLKFQECQKSHWRVHKRDCKDPMLAKGWKPAWIVEHRRASFLNGMSPFEEFLQKGMDEFSSGVSLWGNMPAMDVLNLPKNEKDSTTDFSLAFVASGDLRHVIRTVNSLPPDFSGNLNILVNDRCLPIVCRNIILLLILGTISDEHLAADVALHFWYSTFMPHEYRMRISAMFTSLILPQTTPGSPIICSCPLGRNSTISFSLPNEAMRYFAYYSSMDVSISQVQDEYDRIRNAPSRRDFRERMYAKLKPPHRVAFHEFRRFGIVLPFGALNAHFNVPNLSLFSFEGRWLQTDYADPLEGWDLGEVTEVGKAHGATPQDIYGCLYFFLTAQLRTFHQRLRQFPVTFNVYSMDARDLSKALRNDGIHGKAKPPSTRYDRIEVSNILDANYVGLSDVLSDWAPLLAETRTASIVGYFMNWFVTQEDGRASGAGKAAIENVLDKMVKGEKNGPANCPIGDVETMMYLISADMDALYENSKPFEKFLRKQGLENTLRQTRLKLRERHTIVPHVSVHPLSR